MELKFRNRIQHFTKHFMNEVMIMNWRDIDKCYLILTLGGLAFLSWVIWWWVCGSISDIQVWINQSFYPILMKAYSLLTCGFFLVIWLTRKLQANRTYVKIIPYFTIAYFGSAFIFGGFCIGILSPATIAGYVSLVTLALILFDRKVVYLTTIPITCFILLCIGLSLTEKIVYAPIYSQQLKMMPLYKNEFWVYCMLFFYIPIFFTSIILFEMLLTQWRKREQTIQQISLIDPLTGIYNRRKISESIEAIKEQQQPFSIILLDLDYFKNINDRFGHDVGDIVLKQVASILNRNILDPDCVGRFGGEEFIILIHDSQLRQVINIAEQCRKLIENETIVFESNQTLKITASFGVAISTNPFLSTKEEVIRQADQALYLAKRNGRNQVRHFFEIEKIQLHERRKMT